jgi:hypothetical protein
MRSGRKTFFILLGCFFSSIGVIRLLYTISYRVNHNPNGFIRLFPPHRVNFVNSTDLKYMGYYPAGATQTNIYLANSNATDQLIVMNYDFKDSQHIELNTPDANKLAWKTLNIAVDSPDIYMMDGFTPSIIHLHFPFFSGERYSLKRMPFISPIPLSPSSFAMRTYDKIHRQNTLVKETVNPLKIVNSEGALQKQIDGSFCTDGMLLYNKKASRLIYIYFYRNQFVCLDTNLNILYRNNTIDTNSRAKIQLTTIFYPSGHETTMSVPPVYVNRKACTDRDWIFVNSSLLANNEEKKVFDSHSVIDVYSVQNGAYQFSFYLPDHNKKRITDFRVFNNTLVAIYENYIYTFHLNF